MVYYLRLMVDVDTTVAEDIYAAPRPLITAPPPAPAAKVITMERRSVPDDDDIATAETVRMMCDYIRAGIADPVCQAWAGHAVACYGRGSENLAARFWAVFWMLKHCIQYRHDEGELFRIGQRNARDLLTAPAVLMRQAQPKEDCDGFTMAACTLLKLCGIEPFIVTAKVDPQDPSRWSHVFAIAELPGVGLCALDASHGAVPGWMVPRSHIFGYQVWNLDGQRVKKGLPVTSRLQGYMRRGRGMGDCPIDPFTGDTIVCDNPGQLPTYDGGGSGFDWGSFLNTLITTGGKVATVAVAPAGSIIYPQGQVFSPGGNNPLGASATFTGSTTNMLPWLIGGLLVAGLLFSGKGK